VEANLFAFSCSVVDTGDSLDSLSGLFCPVKELRLPIQKGLRDAQN
jgi:hypothetical protein